MRRVSTDGYPQAVCNKVWNAVSMLNVRRRETGNITEQINNRMN